MFTFFSVKNKFSAYEIVLTLIILFEFFIFVLTPTQIQNDSEGYIQMSIIRSFGYSFFVSIFKTFFENYTFFIVLTQFFLGIWASLFTVKTLRKLLDLKNLICWIVFFVLSSPLIYNLKIANQILSEGLAYPLYLFIISHLLLFFHTKKEANYYYTLFLVFLLLLTRGQFLFIIPLLVFFLLFLFLKKNNLKKTLKLIFYTFITFTFCTISDLVYHKIKHQEFVSTPWTGIQIVTLPFFISDKEDYTIFKTKEQQDYFKFIYNRLEEKKILLKNLPEKIDPIDFYSENYTKIANNTISDDGNLYFSYAENKNQQYILNDKMTFSITIPLLINNFKKWMVIYSKNIVKGFHSSEFLLVYILLLAFNIYLYLKKNNPFSIFVIITTSFVISNILFSGIAESIIIRYTFYNKWILITIILYFLQNHYNKVTHE